VDDIDFMSASRKHVGQAVDYRWRRRQTHMEDRTS